MFAFHDHDEIGPRMLARIARHSGLTPEDLWTSSGWRLAVSRRLAPELQTAVNRSLRISLALD